MEPSQCRACGEAILWTKRADNPDRWHRPLDLSSGQPGFCLVGLTVYATTMYQAHVCKPQKIQAYDDQRRYDQSDPQSGFSSAVSTTVDTDTDDGYDGREPTVDPRDDTLDEEQRANSEALVQAENEARRLRWQQVREKRDAELARHREYMQEYHIEVKQKTDCPKCGATRRTKCWNLNARAKGKKIHTVNPHQERIKLYQNRTVQ